MFSSPADFIVIGHIVAKWFIHKTKGNGHLSDFIYRVLNWVFNHIVHLVFYNSLQKLIQQENVFFNLYFREPGCNPVDYETCTLLSWLRIGIIINLI